MIVVHLTTETAMTIMIGQPATRDCSKGETSASPTTGRPGLAGLIEAVQGYFDLMYDCDTARFDQVFLSTVHLHGFRDGQMMAWSAQTYRDILDRRQSPKSTG